MITKNLLKWGSSVGGALIVLMILGPGQSRADHRLLYYPFDESELFFEQNATDGDLGLHLKVDGEGWRRVILTTPRYRPLLDVRVRGNLGGEIGLTELFSESAEPSFDDVSREEFLSLFPPGEYRFFGKTLEGPWLLGSAQLTHQLPGEVVLLSPEEDAEVDPEADLLLEWEPLEDPAPPESVIEFYEVVVEKDEDDERLRVFSVHMLPTDTFLRVPAEFLEAGKDYKVEMIAQETSGNRTAIEVPFATEGGEEEEEDEEEWLTKKGTNRK